MTTRIYGFNQFVQTDHFNLNFLKFSNSGLRLTKDICLAGSQIEGNLLPKLKMNPQKIEINVGVMENKQGKFFEMYGASYT